MNQILYEFYAYAVKSNRLSIDSVPQPYRDAILKEVSE